jgi:hypothetical protein
LRKASSGHQTWTTHLSWCWLHQSHDTKTKITRTTFDFGNAAASVAIFYSSRIPLLRQLIVSYRPENFAFTRNKLVYRTGQDCGCPDMGLINDGLRLLYFSGRLFPSCCCRNFVKEMAYDIGLYVSARDRDQRETGWEERWA